MNESTLGILAALFVIKAIYAAIIDQHPQWQPDGTWLLVAIGVGLCVIAAGIDWRINGPYTNHQQEGMLVVFLLVGGAPVIFWQVIRSVQAWLRYVLRVLEGIANGNAPD